MRLSNSELNRRQFSKKRLVDYYSPKTHAELFTPEEVILREFKEEFNGTAILEIGVGGGRCTPHLLSLSKNYIGIDNSTEMVIAAREAFSGIEFREIDARNMSMFSDNQFDVIWFSFNGIDCVSHEERLEILKDIHRVLNHKGIFVFSSHNIESKIRQAHDLSHIRFGDNPIAFGKTILRFCLGVCYSAIRKHREVHTAEYAILNAAGHSYRLLLYYLSLDKQLLQLERIGFGDVNAFGLKGEVLLPGQSYTVGYMIHYVARK